MDDHLFPTRTQEPYADLLQREEWKIKKAHIMARDKSKCRQCGKSGTDAPLVVHHLCYLNGLDPWEYPDKTLVTLCADCHYEWHQKNGIERAEKHGDEWCIVKKTPCRRCGGVGYLERYYYYQGGICFRCWGECTEDGGKRIRLFTEKKGKTPQEYFDVFVPLTDEEVKRIYSEKHGGISFPFGDVSYLLEAHAYKEKGFSKVELIGNTGELYEVFLDSSMAHLISSDSEKQCPDRKLHSLNVKTLLFKECLNRNYQKYIIVKGDLISYDKAKEMSEEIRNAHQE